MKRYLINTQYNRISIDRTFLTNNLVIISFIEDWKPIFKLKAIDKLPAHSLEWSVLMFFNLYEN